MAHNEVKPSGFKQLSLCFHNAYCLQLALQSGGWLADSLPTVACALEWRTCGALQLPVEEQK